MKEGSGSPPLGVFKNRKNRAILQWVNGQCRASKQSSSTRSAQVMLGTRTTLNYSFGGEPESGELRQGPTYLLDEVDGKDMLSLLQPCFCYSLFLTLYNFRCFTPIQPEGHERHLLQDQPSMHLVSLKHLG